MQRTIVRIIRESVLGIGVVGHFENRAAALYYLAQITAGIATQLETITVDHVYQIGSVNYVLEEVDCLSIEDVARLRRLHEPPGPSTAALATSAPGIRRLPVLF